MSSKPLLPCRTPTKSARQPSASAVANAPRRVAAVHAPPLPFRGAEHKHSPSAAGKSLVGPVMTGSSISTRNRPVATVAGSENGGEL